MSKDYKPRTKKKSSGSPFLTGFLIGFLLGVLISVGLTMYLKGDTSPFQYKKPDTSELDKLSDLADQTPDATPSDEPQDDFDFYDILPETESTVTEKEINDANLTIKTERYFLQVGSFKKVSDADNLKAKLALQGFEAIVQTANIPEQGTWHRVRVGPLNSRNAINKVRDNLTANGFKADLIKINTETKSN